MGETHCAADAHPTADAHCTAEEHSKAETHRSAEAHSTSEAQHRRRIRPCSSPLLLVAFWAYALATCPSPASPQRIPPQQAAVLTSCLRTWGVSVPGWGPPWDCSAAAGVTCDKAGFVTALTLSKTGLLPSVTAAAAAGHRSTTSGSGDVSGDHSGDYSGRRVGREGRLVIPPSLGSLSTLTRLDLSSCGLQGRIPRSLSGLLSLRALNLSSSAFSGPIPPLLCNLTLLTSLDLSGNSFSGPLPPNLGALRNLTLLDASRNRLISELPESLQQLSAALRRLDVSGNALSGAVPPWLSRLTSLTALRLSSNAFSGPIPPSLGALGSLQTLALRNNRLRGPIPGALSALTRLSYLSLGRNFLSGSIPHSITALTALCYLSLGDNQLSGRIPEPSLAKLQALRALDLGGNFLEGGFPSGLIFLPGLRRLDLSRNLLTGAPLPLAPLGLTALTFLSLANNSFAGSVPPSLWDLIRLRHLSLNGNALSGPLPPPGLGLLQRLTSLDLSGNPQLSAPGALGHAAAISGLQRLDLSSVIVGGTLPASLSLLTLLTSLSLAASGLSGPLGTALGALTALRRLDLSGNLFKGPLPGTLSGLSRLTALSLAYNRLSGGVPQSLCALSRLQELDLSHNNLGPTVGATVAGTGGATGGEGRATGGRWEAHDSGSVPACLGSNLRSLRVLRLAHSQLSGPIPGPLLALPRLEALDLSGNRLGGPLPRIQEASRSLRQLALGGNRLAGPLPESLSKATALQVLDLSGNPGLTGGVPPWLASLALLRELSLGGTALEGDATTVLGALGEALPFLERLDLSLGSLTGALPAYPALPPPLDTDSASFSFFSRLSFLNLSAAAGLAGGVPPSVSALSSLAVLDLRGTGVAGALPSTLALLSSLTFLRVPPAVTCPAPPGAPCGAPQAALDAAFCAACPQFCASCPETPLPAPPAVAALLAFQRASGIPGTWTEAPGSLEGVGLDQDGAVTSLSLVGLGGAGGAPLPSLRLDFGALAEELGGTLTRLVLAGCAVAGPLPSGLGLLTALESLDLSRNALSGDLPGSFRNLTHLTSLDLSRQSTPFNTPPSPSSPSPGQGLGGAQILSALTGLEALSLAYSGYTGSFPRELPGALTSLRALDLSGNPGLTGGLPPGVGALRRLTFLGLHATGLRPRVPPGMATLPLRLLLADQGALQCPGNLTHCPPQPVYLPSPLCTQYCPSFCARCPSTNATPELAPSTAPGSSLPLANRTAGPWPGVAPGAPGSGAGAKGLGTAQIAAIVSGTATAFFAALLCIACILKACLGSPSGLFPGFSARGGVGGGAGGRGRVRKFSFRELVQATASFSRRLYADTPGRYMGELASGQVVAVHNIDTKTTRGTPKARMQARVRQLAAVEHPNLVRLVGYCQDPDHVLFVYEFVGGGTLRNLLAHEPSALTWERRLGIGLGLALGLDHLHSALTPPLVHLGLTSNEVIVTRKYVAVVASFGQSGFQLDASRAKGGATRAYVDPSYLQTGVEDVMNDVYSLGVLLLELATGRDPFTDQVHLVQRVQRVLDSEEASIGVMAPQLRRELVSDHSSWGSAQTGDASSSAAIGSVSGSASGTAPAGRAQSGAEIGPKAPRFGPAPSSASSASSSSTASVLTPALFRRFLVVACACCSLDPRHRPTMRLLAAQLQEIQAGSLANPGNTLDSARYAAPERSHSISTSGSRIS